MTETRGLINVYSDENPWIDYVVSVYNNVDKAERIINEAFDDWFEDEEAHAYTISDWIKEKLDEEEIIYDFYYKEESEDEDV